MIAARTHCVKNLVSQIKWQNSTKENKKLSLYIISPFHTPLHVPKSSVKSVFCRDVSYSCKEPFSLLFGVVFYLLSKGWEGGEAGWRTWYWSSWKNGQIARPGSRRSYYGTVFTTPCFRIWLVLQVFFNLTIQIGFRTLKLLNWKMKKPTIFLTWFTAFSILPWTFSGW